MLDQYYVYELVSKRAGKRYIGYTSGLRNRWNQHHAALRRGKHHNKTLQQIWNTFPDIVIDIVSGPYNNLEAVRAAEIEAIKTAHANGTAVNIALGNDQYTINPNPIDRGWIKSEKQRKLASDRRKEWHSKLTPEQKVAYDATRNGAIKKAIQNFMTNLSDEDRVRRSRSSAVPNMKAVLINGNEYESMKAAAVALNLGQDCIRHRVHSTSPKFAGFTLLQT